MNGLKITQTKKQNKCAAEYLLETAACTLLIFGYTKTILSAFTSVKEYWWIYALVLSGISVIFTVSSASRHHTKILFGAAGVLSAAVVMRLEWFINGMCMLFNDILSFMTGFRRKIYLDYPVSGDSGVWFAVFTVLLIITILIQWSLHGKNVTVCTFLMSICCIGCAIELFETDYGLLIIAAGIVVVTVYISCITEYVKSLIYTTGTVTACVAVCTVLGIAVCYVTGFEASFNHSRNLLQHNIHTAKYDDGCDAMPEGNLVNVDKFDRSSDTALIITVQQPQKFYLRGMTGDIYTGSSWESFDEKVYTGNEDLFYWLHKLDFYGETVIAEATDIMGQQQPQSIKIENVSACSEHYYLPYALADNSILQQEDIASAAVKAAANVLETEYYTGSVPQWYQTAVWLSQNQDSSEVSEYLKKEQSYREFAYQNNLQLTNTVVGVFERIFDKVDDEKTLSEILTLVRKTLDDEITYDETIVTNNGKNDFVRYTLEQTKKGYSVHYATAATLMLRYMGVPARYVEGYFISADEAQQYAEGEKITVTEGHAHAWTEYYMDGIGWIPFEVTPGYIDREELDETSVVIADGMGTGSGKAFVQSQLTYTTPKYPENNTSTPDLRSMFRFSTKQVINALIAVLLAAFAVFAVWVFKRYIKLRSFKKTVAHSENREMIEKLFGYASMLAERFEITQPENYAGIKFINEKARFSNHHIDDVQRAAVEKYTEKITSDCKEKHNVLEKIKYHFILWLY